MKELPVPEGDGADAQQTIESILRDPEYDYSPTLFERVMDWIGDRFNDLFGLFGSAGGGATGELIGYLVIVGLVVAAAWMIWRVIRDRLPKPDAVAIEPVIDLDPWQRPDDLRAEAESLTAAGEWREALRSYYRLAIAELVERDLIENPPGRTSGEYLSEVRARLDGAAAPFSVLTGRFEMVWYGDGSSDAEDVAAAKTLVDEVLDPVAT